MGAFVGHQAPTSSLLHRTSIAAAQPFRNLLGPSFPPMATHSTIGSTSGNSTALYWRHAAADEVVCAALHQP